MGIIITNKEIEEIKKLYLIEQNTEFKGKSFDKKMKKENKEKIFNTLDSIGSGDIFGLNKIYNYASKDAFGALLMFFDKYLNVTSKIAKAVLFLASNEDSSFITGENIIVDGGLIYT